MTKQDLNCANAVAQEEQHLAAERAHRRNERAHSAAKEWTQQFRQVSDQRHQLQERIGELVGLLQHEHELFLREAEMCRTLAARRDNELRSYHDQVLAMALWMDEHGHTAAYQQWCTEQQVPF